MKLKILLTMVFLMLVDFSLQAEIQDITLRWTAMLCNDSCVRGLEQQFRRTPGVTNFTVSREHGQANLMWNATTPFSFRPIENAVAMIGLGLNDIRVTVRGTITHDESNFVLTSGGDKSQFILMGPVQIDPNQHIEQNSTFNRTLSPQMTKSLTDAEKNRQQVTITGPLFQPETSPPLILIVQSLNMSENSNVKQK